MNPQNASETTKNMFLFEKNIDSWKMLKICKFLETQNAPKMHPTDTKSIDLGQNLFKYVTKRRRRPKAATFFWKHVFDQIMSKMFDLFLYTV